MIDRPRTRPLGLLLLVVLVSSAACRKGRTGITSFPGAPVILVSIDTLRSDHLPDYGYGGVETPALSAFRKEAILFEKAYSHVPLTLPSHATIFTGTLPATNGIRDNLGYQMNAALPTLAEILKKGGYGTGGAVSTFVLNASSGIGRGFDLWEDQIDPTRPNEPLGLIQRSGAETEKLLAKWVESQPDDKPFFAFLHLYEPHTPYTPPEPYATRYRGREYDGEIAFADEVVGRFFDVLKKKGAWDRALVIFLSDHGEGLGEHGEDEHGIFLYRWALQVPLLVKLPKGERGGTSVTTPVQLSDLFPTIVQGVGIAGIPPPENTLSLLEVAAGGAAPARRIFAETLFPRIHFGWADLASLVEGPWHYIEAPKSELYDLAKDLGEKENLAAGTPQAFRSLRIEMEKRRAGFSAPGAIDPEDAKKLASLGYLSSGASAGNGPLPDPKDEISIVHDLKTGSGFLNAGDFSAAIPYFKKLLARNPRMLDVWDLYARAVQKTKGNEAALEILKQGIAASPDSATHYFVSVANLCLSVGRLDEALKNAEIARSRGDPSASDALARIYLKRKEWNAAEAEALAVLKVRPAKRQPYLILARVEVERNNIPKAFELVEKARALGEGKDGRSLQNLHFLRGDILARMERYKEAEAEFREEIRLFPDGLEAYGTLAGVYAAEGRFTDIRTLVQQLLNANPNPDGFLLGLKIFDSLGDRAGAEAVRRAATARFGSDRRFGAPS